MLFGKRNVDSVVGGSGLQLKVEASTEAFAKRQPPRLVDASSKGCMQNELHPAALVEEALGNDGRLGWNRAQHRSPGNNIRD